MTPAPPVREIESLAESYFPSFSPAKLPLMNVKNQLRRLATLIAMQKGLDAKKTLSSAEKNLSQWVINSASCTQSE